MKENITSYFNDVLENIDIIIKNDFYKEKDKENFYEIKEIIKSWYDDYRENSTLKSINPNELKNIDLEITDFFDKYMIHESNEENYSERLLYNFGHLEKGWKNEMLGR